jgi:predicted ATP-grasp superfamily ATP-dependent carboligase
MTGITRKLTGVITSRPTPTILVHEWVTGGGMADTMPPPSWAAEGRAMRRAIAGDFAALEGGRARVIVTLDDRLDHDPGPWTVERIGARHDPQRVLRLATEADFTVLVAPETMGILEGVMIRMQEVGARWLGSSPDAVALTRNKARLAGWLVARGIDTPPCRLVSPFRGLPSAATYPAVIKPNDGAGTIDTFLVDDASRLPARARGMLAAVMQPYVRGRPMSASFLVDSAGRAWPIGIGEQQITLTDGQFAYRGGRLPAGIGVDQRPVRASVESVPGMRGFVGVDFIWDESRRHATILEINPRPTTSIVGLTRLLPPGRLAAAWIGAFEPGSAREALLPGLAEFVHSRPPLSFDASGNVLAAGAEG